MALLGLNVSFVTRTSDDSDGEWARSAYRRLGMDLSSSILVRGAATSSAAVVVATGAKKQRTSLIHDDPVLYAPLDPKSQALQDVAARLAAGEFSTLYTDGWQL